MTRTLSFGAATRWLPRCALLILVLACATRPKSAPGPPTESARETSSVPAGSPASAPELRQRKLVRRAELALEVAGSAAALANAERIATRLGGYVLTSSARGEAQTGASDAAEATLRVPSDRLEAALSELKRLGRGQGVEHISTQDVSDEFIDVEARLLNQKRLEEQIGKLLDRTSTLDTALNMGKELANVRTEIDRLEGRRKFLEQEAAFATIDLSLSTKGPLLTTTFAGFRDEARLALSDALSISAAIVLASIRLLGVLVPLALLLAAPFAYALQIRRRRNARANP